MFKQIRRVISIIILTAFVATSIKAPVYAQIVDPMPRMPAPGVMVRLSPEFTPAILKGIVIHPENALKFDFIIYKGNTAFNDQQKKAEYTKLIKYFLASLAVPDDNQWVNLSPYEKDRIIKDDFGKTEMGRDLLAQDYLLKQITASLIYPQDKLGQKFWDKVYSQAQKQFGTTNIPVNTFNKVWIVPDDALVYEKGNTAYVVKNHLKVMLEEDYLSLAKHSALSSPNVSVGDPAQGKSVNKIGSQVVREVVLPALEQEVNTAKNFAPLRQVFSGMVLAAWYKRALKESLLGRIYMNKSRIKGVDQNPNNNEVIYKQYLKAFKKGVFNFIKEDVDKYTNETIPRKYFSGGATELSYNQGVPGVNNGLPVLRTEPAMTAGESASAAMVVQDSDLALVAATEDVQEASVAEATASQAMLLGDRVGIMKGKEQARKIDFAQTVTGQNALLPFLQASEGEDDPTIPKLNLKFKRASVDKPITNYVSTDPIGGGFPNEKLFTQYLGTLKEEISPDLEAILQKFLRSEYGHRLRKALGKLGIQDITVDLIPAELWDDYYYAFAVRHIVHQNDHLYVSVPGTATNVLSAIIAMINGVASTSWGKDVLASEGLVFQSEDDVLPVSRAPSLPPYFVLIQILKQVNILPVAASEHLETEAYSYQRQLHQMLKNMSAEQDLKGLTKLLWEQLPESGRFPLMGAMHFTDRQTHTEQSVYVKYHTPNFSKDEDVRRYIRELRKPGAFRLTYIHEMRREGHSSTVIDIDLNELFGEQIKALLNLRNRDDNDLKRRVSIIEGKTSGLNPLISRLITRALENDFLTFEGGAHFQGTSQPEKPRQLNAPNDDLAMRGVANTGKQLDKYGGIDFNAANLNLQIKRDGKGVPLPISQQDLENIHIDGLIPVIIEIRPASATNLLSQFTNHPPANDNQSMGLLKAG